MTCSHKVSPISKPSMEGYSDTLKALLDKETPITEKLKTFEREKKKKEMKEKSEYKQQFEKDERFIPSPRLTRSQTRMKLGKTSSNKLTNIEDEGEVNSEDVSSSSGIQTRIKEIGQECGFKKRIGKGTTQPQKRLVKTGEATKTQ
ncbi:hypothetical protein L2E82_33336 [Cichorium intybus]|uniref:Uncharacterized protein n=1 Tax=Cichorium intybus TaxID=13427 RepID=A0ACB9BK88_CICIN|nr:hypothetical protein L2E82_33336 [Cichorium intybus]